MTEKGRDMSEELLQQYGLFIIGAGLALVLLLILFLLLRRSSQNKKGLRPAAAAIAAEAEAEKPIEPSLSAPVGASADDSGTLTIVVGAESGDDADGGFKLFKRESKKPAKDKVSKSKDTLTKSDIDARLRQIEQEMLAIRELFRNGEITQSVYVAETQALYDTAKLIQD